MKLRSFLLAMMLCAFCVTQASALEYDFDAPEDYLFGQPTSDDTIYEWENPNVDRSKNAALVAPGFGTPTSYLPGSGEYLTPNLVPGYQPTAGAFVNGSAVVILPPDMGGTAVSGGADTATDSGALYVPGASAVTVTGSVPNTASSGYTEVTDELYYSGGYLGTLKIPAIGLSAKIYQGTDSSTLAKGIGHFEDSSIWDGNVCFAGHNRGTNNYFGKIHTLEAGDTITLTTMLGTRTYAVASVEKVSVTDSSDTAATTDNRVTLYTCVMNQPDYRWCVTAIQQA